MSKTAFVRAASFQAPRTQLDRLRRALAAGAEVVIEQPTASVSPRGSCRAFWPQRYQSSLRATRVVLLRGESELSPAEAGELLGISRQFVDRLIDVGRLPARRLPGSRHRRLRVADVVAFAEQREERQGLVSDAVNDAR